MRFLPLLPLGALFLSPPKARERNSIIAGSLLRDPAAVAGISRAGDGGGAVAAQEYRQRSYSFRLGKLMHRLLLRQQRDFLIAHRFARGLGASSICFCTSVVSTQPGQMALQVMPE